MLTCRWLRHPQIQSQDECFRSLLASKAFRINIKPKISQSWLRYSYIKGGVGWSLLIWKSGWSGWCAERFFLTLLSAVSKRWWFLLRYDQVSQHMCVRVTDLTGISSCVLLVHATHCACKRGSHLSDCLHHSRSCIHGCWAGAQSGNKEPICYGTFKVRCWK